MNVQTPLMRHDFSNEASYERERKRRYRSKTGGTTRKALRPFVGVDGEGGNVPHHEYLLLRAGNAKLETGRPLTSLECLAFLSDLPSDKSYVGYFFDYDVTMILRGLPEERIRRLVTAEGRAARTRT